MTIACAAAWLWSSTGGAAAAAPAPAPTAGTVSTIELPGGVEGVRRALGDRHPMTAATVGVELTRRFHGGTAATASEDPRLGRLRAWLRTCAVDPACGAPELHGDRVPLPGDAAFWGTAVFGRRMAPAQTLIAILDRRDASLLYTALLSMREDVRAWLLARPALVRQLLAADAGPLLVAAPYLRLEDGRWSWPGGREAAATWATLAGLKRDDPEAALPALLRAHDGLLAYAVEVVSTLSPAQQAAVLELREPDESRRIAAGAALLGGLRVAARGWQIHERPFWRPSPEPAFLLAQVPATADGRLALGGGRAFWSLVFGAGDLSPHPQEAQAAWRDAPPSAGWLVERVWTAAPIEQPTRYEQVLFAARWLAAVDAAQAADALTVLRGYGRYPQLLRVLDRIGVGDLPMLAALVRRAGILAQQGGDWRGRAALVRWQSVLACLDHVVGLDGIDAPALHDALDALATTGDDAMPRGARVRALAGAFGIERIEGDVHTRPVERAFVARLTRCPLGLGQSVSWEGRAYRLDIGAGERDRLARVRGRDALPRLDAAWAAFDLASRGGDPDPAAWLAVVDGLASAIRLDRPPTVDEDFGREARVTLGTLRHLLGGTGARHDAPQIRAALDDLGEALAAEGLAELAYAVSMGFADDLPLTALAAFRRHQFTKVAPVGAPDPWWQPPAIGTTRGEPWRVSGSLLGLDEALAPVALRRASLRPLPTAPSLNTGDRRWFVATAAGLDRRRFTEEARTRLLALVANGQARLHDVHGAAAAADATARAGLSPLRQTLAAWIAEASPEALPASLSLTDLVRLGADGPLPGVLDGWGNAQTPFTGRLGAGPLPSLPAERYAGRATRLIACAVPDLQLALAARLADLDLPAILVPDLMPAASFELVNLAAPLHADDADALAGYVRDLTQASVERYLALLTTAGPLRVQSAEGTP